MKRILCILLFLSAVSLAQTTTTVNFDNPTCPSAPTNYGGITWTASPWDCESVGIHGDSTVTLSWSQNITTGSFKFNQKSILNALLLGGSTSGTLTLTTDAGEKVVASNSANNYTTVMTGFSKPASVVTVKYTGSWNIELDNIQYTVPATVNNPTASLNANPTSIIAGQSSTLTWSSTNGVSATLNGSSVALSGSQQVTPSTTTQYTLAVTGTSGTTPASAGATVTVNPPPPITVTINPTAATIQPNGQASFTATVTNTTNTAVTWSETCGSIAGSGNTVTYTAPASTGTCTLTATSVADISKTATATITVSNSTFQGYGANATGGTNVAHVTNLNASGAGSFAAALANSGNHIVFDVAGTINGTFYIPGSTFVDGFSAPSPGITFTGGTGSAGVLVVQDVSNVIIQGVRVRGDSSMPDNTKGIMLFAINGTVHDVVVDHCEIESVTDEDIGTSGSGPGHEVYNVTVSYNLIGAPASSGGQLVKYGAYHVSIHHNLWVNLDGSDSRVPLVWAGDDSLDNFSWNGATIADVVGNVETVFLYGITYVTDGVLQDPSNIMNNYLDGQDVDHARNGIDIMSSNLETHYIAGNASVLNPVGTPRYYGCGASNICDTYPIVNSNTLSCTGCQLSSPVAMPTITTSCVYDAAGRITEWQNVINTAGVVTHFADDSTSAALRAVVTTPTTAILSQGWNQQTGSCQ